MKNLETQPLLGTEHLWAGYSSSSHVIEVIKDASLSLMPGSVTCLLGANGSGKSTLLRTIGGQQAPLKGKVEIGGVDPAKAGRKAMAKLLSVVYTERTHAGALTVEELVGLGRQPYTGFFGRLDPSDKSIVTESLRLVGLEQMRQRYVGTLSDGERQKAMIARALAQQTPVMLLDEPTSFLDVASRLEVMALLGKLAGEQNMAILLSTHDVPGALAIASQLWLVNPNGHITAGPAQELVNNGSMNSIFPNRGIEFSAEQRDFRLK
ncbi:MAG: ABC transporter ATP-binding protein [Firmicutes bacterium]|nr:ABC transporter ATP-binding protein [Bacillota bacterium]MCM1401284.1 ABC transporter ATP-binding protein [Bacteroides sp.]MCM1476761.1 ABC transporter ATP-binding protein [Bacteroides sp.]